MAIFGVLAGLGASFCWALGSLLAFVPARRLGAFELTRTQLVSSSLVLLVIVSISGGWTTVSWVDAPAFAVASVVGVVLGNLAMMASLARGGPRRTQLLMALSTPVAALLGYLLLGEMVSTQQLAGAALILGGVLLAIQYGGRSDRVVDGTEGAVRISFLLFGGLAATCSAIGLVALKPALVAGTDPLAATALRTGGGALLVAAIALWPVAVFEPASPRTGRLVVAAILPGILGYVVAVSLQLYALQMFSTGVAAVLGSAAPVMILPMSWLATRRRPALPAWIGAGMVVAGVALIVLR